MVCVTGIVIVGEDTVGHYDLGIFIASIVPGGPADKDGRIRPGRESFFTLSCVHLYVCVCRTFPFRTQTLPLSVEGVTFSKGGYLILVQTPHVCAII